MSKEMLYNGWLKVERIFHPDGRPYEKLHMHSAVAGLVRDDHMKILMVKQYRPAIKEHTWELPAGILDIKGEHPMATLKRECQEEADLSLENFGIGYKIAEYRMSQGCADAVMHIYALEYFLEGKDKIIDGDDDVEEIKWFSTDEFLDYCDNNLVGSKELFVARYVRTQQTALDIKRLTNNLK